MLSWSDGMNIYDIIKKIEDSGRAVYNANQLSNLISKNKKITSVYISRLINKKLVSKIQKGTISTTNNDLIIATQLIEPSYISLNSALLFHNLLTQIPKNTECVTTINSRYIKSEKIYYHKTNPKYYFGFKKYKIENSYAFIADPEKAILDGLYYKKYNFDYLLEMRSKINYYKLKKYSKLYNNKIKEMIKNVR